MPLVEKSSYQPPVGFANPHVQIFHTSLFRVIPAVEHTREPVPTPDDDFLQLDWVRRVQAQTGQDTQPATPPRTLIIMHGLESHARLPYINAAALAFLRQGWEVAALNFRDCGDTPNKLWQSYHSGVAQDVATVVNYVASRRPGHELALLGFSLGGNVLLKYLSGPAEEIPQAVGAAVAISVPVDVSCAVTQLTAPGNRFYNWRFMNSLRWRLRRRCERFPGMLDEDLIPKIRTFREFDEIYTAPAHGYQSATDYWTQASSAPHLERIRVPTLILNALDDPFLGDECYPVQQARASEYVHLETPAHGSHVGFLTFGQPHGEFWHETRAREFIHAQLEC